MVHGYCADTKVSRNVSEIELGAVVAPVTTLICCIGFVHRVERKCEQSLDGSPVLLCSTLSCHSITWIWTPSLKYFQLLTIIGPSMWLSDVHLDLITVKMSRNLKTSSAVFVSSTKLHNFHSTGSKQGWKPHLIFYFMWHSSLFDKGKPLKTRWALVFIVSGKLRILQLFQNESALNSPFYQTGFLVFSVCLYFYLNVCDPEGAGGQEESCSTTLQSIHLTRFFCRGMNMLIVTEGVLPYN